MLTLILGADWKSNSHEIFNRISRSVRTEQSNQILIVPELISFETERMLCEYAGNTASRFAQVLSFTRLASRVAESVGHGAPACLDDGGRLVAMASAAKQLHSKLKAYAAVETKPEFLMGMLDAIDEFKRCCISPCDLMSASNQTEGSFAQKLEELSLLYETYNSITSQGKRDPRDQMDWLYNELCDSDFAQRNTVYVDGFPDFTRQHMQILAHFICNSPSVTIAVNCDELSSDKIAFEKAGQTAHAIVQIAKRNGIPFEIVRTKPAEELTSSVWQNLLQGPMPISSCVKTYMPQSVHEECLLAADRVLDLIEGGARFKDIRLVCPNLAGYRSAVEFAFRRCNIPLYLSGKEDILSQSVVHTVLSALDAVINGFETQDVLTYLKSALCPICLADCDRIENYVYVWSISGKGWLTKWDKNPHGLAARWTEYTDKSLENLNAIRTKLMEPLLHLHDAIHNAVRLKDMIQGVYVFLDEIHMAKGLESLAAQMEKDGQLRSRQILNQLWEILLKAFDQLDDMLGNTAWKKETFVRLLKLLLSQYSVGTIPSTLDAVAMGDITTMRCQSADHLILLGAEEGSLPPYAQSSGVLSDHERTTLRNLGIPLTGGAIDGLQISFSEIFATFCGAKRSIHVSCPGGQASYIFKRLTNMSGGLSPIPPLYGGARVNPDEAGAYFACWHAQQDAAKLGLQEAYNRASTGREQAFGKLSRELVEKLYGKTLHWSASQIDKLAKCRLMYFLEYGLRVRERKVAEIDPLEYGNFVHAVLEDVVRDVIDLGGFRNVSFEVVADLAKTAAQAYASEHFSQLDSKRISYLFQRNSVQISYILQEIYEEFTTGQFEPIQVELGFGYDGPMPAVHISGKTMDAELGGRVDRVDAWKQGEKTYFRVVDYKTGGKKFDYCEVLNGIGLQMLLYLFALEDEGEEILGAGRAPAGVQYFAAKAPIVTAKEDISEQEAQDARISTWKRNGLVLNDKDVLSAMEPETPFRRLPCKENKNGDIVGDVADKKQLQKLKKYISMFLSALLDDLSEGNVEPNPYMRGRYSGACVYCPYTSICAQREITGERNYEAVKAEKFWDDIDREVSPHGSN